MNLQQLNYIVALDQHRHFATAAEHCHVTQQTLSMMVMKLEEELNVKLFDRSKQPVVPTLIGKEIIEHAKLILAQTESIRQIALDSMSTVKGNLRISIIPTLAPYLLPLFLKSFLETFPLINLRIQESTTNKIIEDLENEQTDVGILATPLLKDRLREIPIFQERFFVYDVKQTKPDQTIAILKPEEPPRHR